MWPTCAGPPNSGSVSCNLKRLKAEPAPSVLALFDPAPGDKPSAEVARLEVLQGALGSALRVHLHRHHLHWRMLEGLAVLLAADSCSLPHPKKDCRQLGVVMVLTKRAQFDTDAGALLRQVSKACFQSVFLP